MPRPAPALAVALVALAAIAGCGDGEGSESAATTATSGATGASSEQAKAEDADTKASVRAAQTTMENYALDHGGSYAGATANDLSEIEPVTSGVGVDDATATGYTLTGTSPSGNTFTIERGSDGNTTLTCTQPGVGGCPENGEW